MSTPDAVTCRCSQCGRRFRVMADEDGLHDCPSCGYGPEDEDREDRADEDDADEDDEEDER